MLKKYLRDYGLYVAWLVSIVATGGSLYFSDVMGFVPCKLCWYQRILMYPLVLVLGLATFRNARGIASYTLPLSILGLVIAAYHYLLVEQKLLGEGESPFCTIGAPCDTKYIEWFGFITIPLLSLIAFSLITLALVYVRRASYEIPETMDLPLPGPDVDFPHDPNQKKTALKSSGTIPVIALLLAGVGALILGFDLSRKYPGELPSMWSMENLVETPGALKVDGVIETGEYQYLLKSSRINMQLYWSVKGSTVYFGAHAPTQGWVGIGFNDDIPLMRGSDVIIGYIKEGQLYWQDGYANTRTGHQADTQLGGQDNLLNVAGLQTEEGTTIEFSRLMDTGDPYDISFHPGEKKWLLLSYGQRRDFSSYHERMRSLVPNFLLTPGVR